MKFITWYNEEHRHSAIRYVTPADRHEGKDADILAGRRMMLLRLKEKNPGRWSTDVRNCEPIGPPQPWKIAGN
jgi:putative transposase